MLDGALCCFHVPDKREGGVGNDWVLFSRSCQWGSSLQHHFHVLVKYVEARGGFNQCVDPWRRGECCANSGAVILRDVPTIVSDHAAFAVRFLGRCVQHDLGTNRVMIIAAMIHEKIREHIRA